MKAYRKDRGEYFSLLEVGGGVNPSSSTIVQEEGLDVGIGLATQARNHLSPRGLVGLFASHALHIEIVTFFLFLAFEYHKRVSNSAHINVGPLCSI